MFWEKLALISLIIVLCTLIYDYYRSWHNVDLAVNFIRLGKEVCDYTTSGKCVDMDTLYIHGISKLLILPIFISIISMLIGFGVCYESRKNC